jgi:hypothetical protein
VSGSNVPLGAGPGWATGFAPRARAGDEGPRLRRRSVLIAFVVVVGTFLALGLLLAFLSDVPAPPPDCQPGTDCGGPPPGAGGNPAPGASAAPTPQGSAGLGGFPPGTVGIRAGTPWTNAALGYEFEYTDWWQLDTSNSSAQEADLVYQGSSGDGLLIVAAMPTSQAAPQAYADQWFARLRDSAPDLKADEDPRNAILGPEIGFIDGIGRTYAGSLTSPQSGTEPIGVSLIVASDGRTTVAVVLVVWNPDKAVGPKWLQYNIRSRAEIVLKTFRWGPPA